MRALKTLTLAFALSAVVVLAAPERGHAQVRGGRAAARSYQLGLGAGGLGLTSVQKARVAAESELDLDAGPPINPPQPYYYGYAPWWSAPPSIKYKRFYYPHPGENEPRLGLRAWDPFSWEMGIQLPVDSEPLPTYVPSQVYEGMVAKALRSKLEKERLKGRDPAIELMKAGKYRQAGRVLADGFRRDDSPRYPLLLAEVFFGLGKFAHGQLLLEEALRDPEVGQYLPRTVADHFPSQEEFDEKLTALEGQGDSLPLLLAYFQLHSKTPDKGLELLRTIVQDTGNPLAEAAGILYRHYLVQVFAEEEEP